MGQWFRCTRPYVCIGIDVHVFMAHWVADRYVFQPPSVPSYDDDPSLWTDHHHLVMRHERKEATHAVIYVHGNAEDAGSATAKLLFDHLEACSVYVPEYPGYGHAPGRPSVDGIQSAVEDALGHVRSLRFDEKNIFVVGYSLGTGSSIRLAADHPALGGLVLLEAFTTLRDVARTYMPRAGCAVNLMPVYYDNLDAIRRVRCPTRLFHNQRDPLIPFAHSQMLCDACRGSELVSLDHDRHSLRHALVQQHVVPGLAALVGRARST